MHDFQRSTAGALPGFLHQLKEGGYKVVQRGPTQISIDSFEDLPGVADALATQFPVNAESLRPRRDPARIAPTQSQLPWHCDFFALVQRSKIVSK